MLPQPLHAAVVHFPIVLAVFLPISAVIALYAIRRGVRPLFAWGIPVVLAGALAVSAFVAVKTGQSDEERVENVVGEQPLHAHEEAAERFLYASAGLLLLAALGLAGGAVGTSARLITTLATLAVVVLGVQVGHAGGQLVYKHGAAASYAQGPTASGEVNRDAQAGGDRAEKGEDEEH